MEYVDNKILPLVYTKGLMSWDDNIVRLPVSLVHSLANTDVRLFYKDVWL